MATGKTVAQSVKNSVFDAVCIFICEENNLKLKKVLYEKNHFGLSNLSVQFIFYFQSGELCTTQVDTIS